MAFEDIKAVTFDVFGAVVDGRTSVARVPDAPTDLSVDITASDFNDLAEHLGA